jgi:peptide chain release factor 1
LQADLDGAVLRIAELEAQLKVLLLPADPHDGKNTIVEIRGAEGKRTISLLSQTGQVSKPVSC